MKKYFIITLGPTGSGKSGLVKATLKQLHIDENSTYTKFLIDDLIENDLDYKTQIKLIIENIEKKCNDAAQSEQTEQTNTIECEKQNYENPTPELLKQFETAYFYARTHGCTHLIEGVTGCGNVLDTRLNQIKTTNPPLPIVVFETTGTYIPTWLLSDNFIPNDYDIIISYSFVNLDNLIMRNKSRAYNDIINFKQNYDLNSAPRFPDISKETFSKLLNIIRTTAIDLYKKCIKSYDELTCGNRKINNFLLFDNNGVEYKNIININTKSEIDIDESKFIELIDKSLGDIIGGKKQKTKRQKSKRQKSKRQKSKRQKIKRQKTKQNKV